MKLRNWIKELDSLRFVVDKLNFSSTMSRDMFLDRDFSEQKMQLQGQLALSQRFLSVYQTTSPKLITQLSDNISQIRDIRNSVDNLSKGFVLTEVELFEIKRTAYFVAKVREITSQISYSDVEIDSLEDVFVVLDPQHKCSPTFHLYDDYSSDLARVRAQLRECETHSKAALYEQLVEQQSRVLITLCEELKSYSGAIYSALESVCTLDFLLTSTNYYLSEGFVMPQFSDSICSIKGLFNPMVRSRVESSKGVYQFIDIEFGEYPIVIKGANMCGKSVILNSIALCQVLAQFGMFVPALKADIVLKESIFISMSDSSSLTRGLSSFGAEILALDALVERLDSGQKILVLIDEAARTTNPTEGVAIISALCDIFTQRACSALITTHYSGIAAKCKFMRVKGLSGVKHSDPIAIDRLNNMIDYSLEECNEEDTPHEAINIAHLLGVGDRLLEKAKKYIDNGTEK